MVFPANGASVQCPNLVFMVATAIPPFIPCISFLPRNTLTAMPWDAQRTRLRDQWLTATDILDLASKWKTFIPTIRPKNSKKKKKKKM